MPLAAKAPGGQAGCWPRWAHGAEKGVGLQEEAPGPPEQSRVATIQAPRTESPNLPQPKWRPRKSGSDVKEAFVYWRYNQKRSKVTLRRD
nr:uncharacterized protein LOC104003620 isoform X3 [Pan troglodytes]